MSEEKLYAVKNDEGEWADTNYNFGSSAWATPDKSRREEDARRYGGHVVTLVEEPEKVVLSKEQAEIVERAHIVVWPATYISGLEDGSEQRLLMNAYVNGYTVEKPKLFLVKVPHTDDSYFYKIDDEYCNAGDSYHLEGMTDKKWFTEADIEHYGLQDCEKVEAVDDGE